MTLRRGLVFAAALAATTASSLVATPAYADDALVDYVVKKGDTCAGIAKAIYGDARRVDLLHDANPSLGPQPHHLIAGTVLKVPPKAQAPVAAPDARLVIARNKTYVFVPDEKRGQPNDPLFRGNRVSTLAESSANVLFRDETELRLGEDTLVVILGDMNTAASKVPKSNDTTLVNGSLRAHLGSLAGRSAGPTIATSAGTVGLGAGDVKVDVDAKKTTRLAVYKGRSSLTAQKKSVEVPEGFGSKAEQGKAPTAPRPLPRAPVWSTAPGAVVFAQGDDGAELAGLFAAAKEDAAPSAWRVQLAHDREFNALEVDARVEKNVTALNAKRLTPGAYFARVSAFDADGFEGPFGEVATSAVVRVKTRETSPRTTEIVLEGPPVACGVDGAPLTVVSGVLVVDPRVAHTLRCAPEGDTRAAETATRIALAPRAVAPAVIEARWREVDASLGNGDLEVTLLDATGAPIVAPNLTATSNVPGVTFGPLERAYKEGSYYTRVRFAPSIASFRVRVRAPGAEGATVESLDVTLPRAAPPVVETDGIRGGFGLSGGIAVLGRGGIAPRVAIDAGLALPANFGELLLGLRLAVEGHGTVDADVTTPPITLARAKHTDVFVGIPIAFRFGTPKAPFALSIGAGPEIAAQSSTATLASGVREDGSATSIGVAAVVSGEARVGPGAIFLDVGYRTSSAIGDARIFVPLDGAFFGLGYRFMP